MKSEDLFLAIGSVEESRLARSELCVSSAPKQEDRTVKRKPVRTLRNLLIAVMIISMLAVAAYAVGRLLIFDSPSEMLAAIFGDDTGFDHSQGSIRPDPGNPDTGILVEPTFDRVEADENVVAEDIAPYVSPVGQSISFNGYTLTVDAFLYDSTTKCGFFTYLLENPAGVDGYKLQSDGEIWYEGQPDMVHVNEYGYAYIIQEKTTDTCLAATYYFKMDSDALEVWLEGQVRYTPEEFDALIAPVQEELRETMTQQEAEDWLREYYGSDTFDHIIAQVPEEMPDWLYFHIAAIQEEARIEAETASDVIRVTCGSTQTLENLTLADGGVVLSPISMKIDVADMPQFHTDKYGNPRITTDNIKSVVIRFRDGTAYTVSEGYVLNHVFALNEQRVPGEGDYSLLTLMFNRVIDLEEVEAVILNDTELQVE